MEIRVVVMIKLNRLQLQMKQVADSISAWPGSYPHHLLNSNKF